MSIRLKPALAKGVVENMKKKAVILFVMLITLSLVGCSFVKVNAEEKSKENMIGGKQQSEEKEEPIMAEEQKPGKDSLGGITLDTSRDEVLKMLGTEYEEELINEGGYYVEPYHILKYRQGITVLVGVKSKKVLEIEVTSSDFPTDLGAKVGDSSQDVAKIYSAIYTVPESIHGGGKLEGWYNLDGDKLIIFDFDLDDESLVNTNVSPDSRVEKIRLTSWKYFD